jgi:hypothetical protein
MLRKIKEPKVKKCMVEALMRDMQGSAAQKLAMFEKLKTAGGLRMRLPRNCGRSRRCYGRGQGVCAVLSRSGDVHRGHS